MLVHAPAKAYGSEFGGTSVGRGPALDLWAEYTPTTGLQQRLQGH